MGEKKSIIRTIVIVFAAISIAISVIPKVLLFLLASILAPDLRDVGRDIRVLSVYGSYGNTGENTGRLAVSNGEYTFIYDDGYLCRYFDEENIIKIKEIGENKLNHMAISDRYLLYGTYDYTNRYDLETGEEISILEGIYIEQVMAIDDTFLVETEFKDVHTDRKQYNAVLILKEDDKKGIEIPINSPHKEYGETHIEFIPMFTTEYEDYCFYIGDVAGTQYGLIGVEKDGIMYSFRPEAVFLVDGHMVTMDDGRYMYNGVSYQIDGVKEDNMKHFAALSHQHNDEIYTIMRKGTGYTMLYANPTAVEEEYLVKISPTNSSEEVLYKASRKTRIVGFDAESNMVILINDKGLIYSKNLDSKETEEIVRLDGSINNLCFEWCNDRLFVFEQNHGYSFIGSYHID